MTASSPKPRRWFSLRFSLAGLLLFMTASAVAVWVWTWPYEEVTTLPGQPYKLITTWKRTLTGGRVRHGRERRISETSERTSHYHNDELHGPYLLKEADGGETTGQYVHGQQDGVWTHRRRGEVTQTAHWRAGQLDGTVELRSAEGSKVRHAFAQDRLLDEAGQPTYFPLLTDEPGEAPSDRMVAALREETTCNFVETPLADVLAFFSDFHQVPLKLDATVPQTALLVTQDLQGLRLHHVLQILSHETGLTCRYHDGAIWLEPGERGAK